MKKHQTILLGLGIGAGAALIFLLVFLGGVYVGSKKAGRAPYSTSFIPHQFGHGTVGTIDSIGDKTLIIKEKSAVIKTVLVDETTLIRRDHLEMKFSDLKKNEQVIVIGWPQEEEGVIRAKIIRVI